MSEPVSIQELLACWDGKFTPDEHLSLSVVHEVIAEAIRRAQKVPASIDRRCMALVVTKLEEAEHWALEAHRIGASR